MTLKKLGLAAVTVTVAATLATQAGAQAAAPSPLMLTGATPPGVCSFNINRALAESTVGKYMITRLGELATQVRAELSAEQTGIQTDAQTLESQKATITPQQYQSRGEALQTRAQAFQRKAQIRQREMDDTKGKAEQTVVQALGPLVQQTATARRCTLLISAEALVLPNPSIDITDSAIASLNVKMTQLPIEREHLDTQGAQ